MGNLITNKHNLEVFDSVRDGESSEEALGRARSYYLNSVSRYNDIIADQGNGKDNYWLNCRNIEQAKADALQIETDMEYFARVRHSYLDDPAKEITEERWWEMFEVLPPCAYTRTSRYEMFYVSEAFHLTYHSFYLYDRQTGKYWTKLGDSCDRTTWIDVALGLRAA